MDINGENVKDNNEDNLKDDEDMENLKDDNKAKNDDIEEGSGDRKELKER